MSQENKVCRLSCYFYFLNLLNLEVPVLCLILRLRVFVLKIFLLITCFCFLMIVFFCACLFDLINSIVCLCGVITRSYLSFLIKQLFNKIVGLLPRLSLDIRLRMMDAIFGG